MGNLPIQAGVQPPFKWSPAPAEEIREPSECQAAGEKKRALSWFLARTKEIFAQGAHQQVSDAPLTEEPETEEADSTLGLCLFDGLGT